MIAIINAHMVGRGFEGGTGVNWDDPDYFTEEEFADLIEETPEQYAEAAPHMIVWEVDLDVMLALAWEPHRHWPGHVWHGCPPCEARALYQQALGLPSNVLPSLPEVSHATTDPDGGA